jgi:tetratricopeptide (TPR) repeat protein
MSESLHRSKDYQGVMVSSTFSDVAELREVLIKALMQEELFPIGMEDHVARIEDDVISVSLNMVDKASAYIGLISHKYGQVPNTADRNPDSISITQLEYEKAQSINLPTLMFIMGDQFPVVKQDVEVDPVKVKKLKEFKVLAKQGRIYYEFDEMATFQRSASHAIAAMRRHLQENISEKNIHGTPQSISPIKLDTPIPRPPDLTSYPPYIGSHKFVGRLPQLETIDNWATSSDSYSVLLFEAIGGAGKSILTWEWISEYSSNARKDWAGKFWYSFYERGATMSDFCRKAIGYITSNDPTNLKTKGTAELSHILLGHLKNRPWLFVLDGLERVLVSYHRYDAAHQADEKVGRIDKIASRHPCSAINPEDDDLLRGLAGASPSKILLTSRLTPKCLINSSNQPIPGVIRESLPGLRPDDAEKLFRNCGITGDSKSIKAYLKQHCDCHPLVIGVLAGLVNNHFPDRGNFDDWVINPEGGGKLDLSKLDLTQKRNHIMDWAVSSIPEASKRLLSTLAILSDAVDFSTLVSLNPAVSPIPDQPSLPKSPKKKYKTVSEDTWVNALEECKGSIRQLEKAHLLAIKKHEKELVSMKSSLVEAITDLEERGLVQYDKITKCFDLHPVVRSVAAKNTGKEETKSVGKRVVDYFSERSQDPFELATGLEEFINARNLIKVLFRLERPIEVIQFIRKNASMLEVLSRRFEAHNDILEILQPFFPDGWDVEPKTLSENRGLYLCNRVSVALRRINALDESAQISSTALTVIVRRGDLKGSAFSKILSLASTKGEQNKLIEEDRILDLAESLEPYTTRYIYKPSLLLARYRQQSILGNWQRADDLLGKIQRSEYYEEIERIAAHHNVVNLFMREKLTEKDLQKAERFNKKHDSALGYRNLLKLRGSWHFENAEYDLAIGSLKKAVELARTVRKIDWHAELLLAHARYKVGGIKTAEIVEHIPFNAPNNLHYSIANLHLEMGNITDAEHHCLQAYNWAIADGEPYCRSSELSRVQKLAMDLNFPLPVAKEFDSNRAPLTRIEAILTEGIKDFIQKTNLIGGRFNSEVK